MPHLAFPSILSSVDLEKRGLAVIDAAYVASRPSWVGGAISHYDTMFLSGLVQSLTPRRVMEIGVASGWSSTVLLKSLKHAAQGTNFQLIAIDLFEGYYLDRSKKTGALVEIMEPSLSNNYKLIVGKPAVDSAASVSGVDLLFIDAHHMHPWATIDLLSSLHALSRGSWVALHDINMCMLPKNDHKNRGPFYLYHLWPDQKINSTQQPSMIGAAHLERNPEEYLPFLVELLHTPWEVKVDQPVVDRLAAQIGKRFGANHAAAILSACAAQNALLTPRLAK